MRSSNFVRVTPLFIAIATFRYGPRQLSPNVSSSPQFSAIDQFVISIRPQRIASDFARAIITPRLSRAGSAAQQWRVVG